MMEKRGRLIGLGPEIHGAQADAADAEAGTAEVGDCMGPNLPVDLEECTDWPTFSLPRYIENTIPT